MTHPRCGTVWSKWIKVVQGHETSDTKPEPYQNINGQSWYRHLVFGSANIWLMTSCRGRSSNGSRCLGAGTGESVAEAAVTGPLEVVGAASAAEGVIDWVARAADSDSSLPVGTSDHWTCSSFSVGMLIEVNWVTSTGAMSIISTGSGRRLLWDVPFSMETSGKMASSSDSTSSPSLRMCFSIS